MASVWSTICMVAATLSANLCGIHDGPPAITLSLPARDARPVTVDLPRLAALKPQSRADLCAGASPKPRTRPGMVHGAPSNSEVHAGWEAARAAACHASPKDAASKFSRLALEADPRAFGPLAAPSARLAALRATRTGDEASEALDSLGQALRVGATVTGASDLCPAAAESFEAEAQLCAADNGWCRTNILVKAASDLTDAGRWRSDRAAFDQSAALYREARALVAGVQDADLTSILNGLGNALSYRSELETGDVKAADLKAAAEAYEAALARLDQAPHGFEWAMLHHNLGTVYDRWAKNDAVPADAAAHTDRALAEYREALSVWTRDGEPDAWASANDNLGPLLVRRGVKRGVPADVEAGVDTLRAALAVREERKSTDPLPWAYTTESLAAALADRADLPGHLTAEAARHDRDEALGLITAAEPVLQRSGGSLYLVPLRDLKRRLETALGTPAPHE